MTSVCEGCGAMVEVSAAAPLPFACPHAGDDRDHVLVPVGPDAPVPTPGGDPFVTYRRWLSGHALCGSDAAWLGIVAALDGAVRAVDGVGFTETPLGRLDAVDVWAKDETGAVGRSHKARHLAGIALHLQVVRALGWLDAVPRLAIASCGNAALAAATLAAALGWGLDVYVPASADARVLARLRVLGAEVRTCARVPGERGDPSFLRFSEAVAAGATPFCVQGPVNGLTLEGGQTLAWELVLGLRARGVPLDHLVVQVGGGALASACVRACERLAAHGVPTPRIHAVQTRGAWPLERAWALVRERAAADGVEAALEEAAAHRSAYMWPWETEPHSVAHGILDDETYDWHRVVAGLVRTGGEAVVVGEQALLDATAIARAAGVPASPTGAAGLAGALALRASGAIPPGQTVAVLLTG